MICMSLLWAKQLQRLHKQLVSFPKPQKKTQSLGTDEWVTFTYAKWIIWYQMNWWMVFLLKTSIFKTSVFRARKENKRRSDILQRKSTRWPFRSNVCTWICSVLSSTRVFGVINTASWLLMIIQDFLGLRSWHTRVKPLALSKTWSFRLRICISWRLGGYVATMVLNLKIKILLN